MELVEGMVRQPLPEGDEEGPSHFPHALPLRRNASIVLLHVSYLFRLYHLQLYLTGEDIALPMKYSARAAAISWCRPRRRTSSRSLRSWDSLLRLASQSPPVEHGNTKKHKHIRCTCVYILQHLRVIIIQRYSHV